MCSISHPQASPSLNDSTWSCFFKACGAEKALSAKRPPARAQLALKIHGPACELCKVGLVSDTAHLCFLVPTQHGGTTNSLNDVLLCPACEAMTSKRDLLEVSESAQLPPALLARRMEALKRSHNHLAPNQARGNRSLVRGHLEKRWAYPRASAFIFDGAELCLVAFSLRHNNKATVQAWAVSLQTMGCIGTCLDRYWAGFAFDGTKTMQVIEALIECNVYCRLVEMEGLPRQKETTKLAREWWLTGTDIGQCR